MRPPLKVRPTKKKLILRKGLSGLGLFAGEELKRKDFVIEYTGPLLTDAESQKKGGKYLFEIDQSPWTIDGTSRKNRARYINHSCKPNCVIEVEGWHIRVYAKRRIAVGEELTYDYGKEYMADLRCRCGHCNGKRPKIVR